MPSDFPQFNGVPTEELKVGAVWRLLRHQLLCVTSSYSSCFLCKTPLLLLLKQPGKILMIYVFLPQGKDGEVWELNSQQHGVTLQRTPTYLSPSVTQRVISLPSCLSRVYLTWHKESDSCLTEDKDDYTNSQVHLNSSPRFLPPAFIIPNLSPVEADSS